MSYREGSTAEELQVVARVIVARGLPLEGLVAAALDLLESWEAEDFDDWTHDASASVVAAASDLRDALAESFGMARVLPHEPLAGGPGTEE